MRFRAPFPWFGGKSQIAAKVWERFGEPEAYAEPFAGSAAMLLARPGWTPGVKWTEQINDANGYVANFWRAVVADPDAVAHYADWPCNENDLHARHAWLVGQRDSMRAELEGDPDWCDFKIAGWWVWGMALWIGGGFCSGDGPWHVVDGKLVHSGNDGKGVRRQLVHLGGDGQGVQRKRVHLGGDGKGVQRKRVHLGGDGQGVHRQRVHLGGGQGVHRQLVHLADDGKGVQRKRVHLGGDGQGVHRQLVHLGDGQDAGTGEAGLYAWMRALAERLRYVRVICGDWTRSVTPVARGHTHNTTCAVFLDPPYADADRDPHLYGSEESLTVAHDVRDWCMENSDDPTLRIALCGYVDGDGHETLEDAGWTTIRWTANGGYQGLTNRHRECVWLSPSCLAARTPSLFGDAL